VGIQSKRTSEVVEFVFS